MFLSTILIAMLIPTMFITSLRVISWLVPLLLIVGIPVAIRRGRPSFVPTWVVYDVLAVFLVIYGVYSIGQVVPAGLLVIALIAMGLYELFTEANPQQMESIGAWAIKSGIPIAILFPRSEAFEFRVLQKAMENKSFQGTFEVGPTGCTIVGVLDLILPGALAVSFARTAASNIAGTFTISIPAIGVVVGVVIGFAGLLYLDPDPEIGGSTAAIVGSLVGLVIGMAITGHSLLSLIGS